MLKKINRITKTKEIDGVFKNGRSSFDNILGVKILPAESKISRFVVVVSTKVSKKATLRNKIKRRLQEIIRLNLLKLKPNFDFFILALPASKDSGYHELEKSLLSHFKRSGVL